jgi:hypothetical protein
MHMRRTSIGICILLAAIAADYAPLLNGHDEQDDCVFGPVSNADYRAYLARAKAQLGATAPSIDLDSRALALRLDGLFENLSRDRADIYSRIAIMHAVLRSAGAEYRNTNGTDIDEGRSDPFLKAANGALIVSFHYLLDVNRLWIFALWPREAWVIGSLAGPQYKRPVGPWAPKRPGGIAFVVNGPSLLERPLGFAVRRDGACPPIPIANLADNFALRPE